MTLFSSPIKVGNAHLEHRVVLAPLTRFRATRSEHVPVVPLVKEYYEQRGSVPGTLLISEATFIAPEAGGYSYVPGIWNSDQIEAWKQITDAVHAKGSYIFLQLWALGRTATAKTLVEEGNYPLVAPSPIPLSDSPSDAPAPRALTTAEIDKYVSFYVEAAKNAIAAGFDGVEVHGANGYLIDQFLQDVSNTRTDEYGGSIENRSRFGLRVVDEVVKAIGEEKTAIRLSPWGRFQNMKMRDPLPQFSHFVSSLVESHPNLAFVHLVEPPPIEEREDVKHLSEIPSESNDFIRKIWAPRPLVTTGFYTRDDALKVLAENKGALVGFGRYFISNPDLPFRLEHNLPLTPLDRSTIYTPSDKKGTEKGYIDYPFSEEFLKKQKSDSKPQSVLEGKGPGQEERKNTVIIIAPLMRNTTFVPFDRDSLDDYIPIGACRRFPFVPARRPSVLALLQSVARHSQGSQGDSKDHKVDGPNPPQSTRTLSLICAEHGENWGSGDDTVGGVKSLIAFFDKKDKLDQLSPMPIPTPSCTKRLAPTRPRMKPKPSKLPSLSTFPRDATVDEGLLNLPQDVYALSFEAMPSPSTEASSEGEGTQLLLSDKDVVDIIRPSSCTKGMETIKGAFLGSLSPMTDFEPVFIPPGYSNVQGQWTQLEPAASSRPLGIDQPLPSRLRLSKAGYPLTAQDPSRPRPGARGLSFTLSTSEVPQVAQQTTLAMPSPAPAPGQSPASHPSSFSSGLSYMTPPPPALATIPLPSVDSFRSDQGSASSIPSEDGEDQADSEELLSQFAPSSSSHPFVAGAPKLLSKPPLSQVRRPNLIDNVRCESPEPIEEAEVPLWQIYESISGRDDVILAWRNRVQMEDDDDGDSEEGEESVCSDEAEGDDGATEYNGGLNWYREDKAASPELRDVWHDDGRDKGCVGYAEAVHFPYDEGAQWGRPWLSLCPHASPLPFNMDVPLPIVSPPLSPLVLNEDKGFFPISRQLRSLSGCRQEAVGTMPVWASVYKTWAAHNTPHSSLSLSTMAVERPPPVATGASLPAEVQAPVDNKDDNPLLSVPCLQGFNRETLDSALSEFTDLSKLMNRSRIRTMFSDTSRWPPAPIPGIHRWEGIGEYPVRRDTDAWPPRLPVFQSQSTFGPPGLLAPPRYVKKLPLLLRREPTPLNFDRLTKNDDNSNLNASGSGRFGLFDDDDDEAYFDELSKEIDLSRRELAEDSPDFLDPIRPLCLSPIGLDAAEPIFEDDGRVAQIVDQSEFAVVPELTYTRPRGDSLREASAGVIDSLDSRVGSFSKVDGGEFREESSDSPMDIDDGKDQDDLSTAFEDEDRHGNLADFAAYRDHESGIIHHEIDELDTVNDVEAGVANGDDDGGEKERNSRTCRPASTIFLGLGLVAKFLSQGFRMAAK
ncbi:hypothetical protein MD484_g1627, partial [Candolleomyces efflorescens]